ncbi:MAG: hypothetical protein ABI197_03330 [Granulicella sp.]
MASEIGTWQRREDSLDLGRDRLQHLYGELLRRAADVAGST